MGAAPTRRGTFFEARLVVLAFWEPVFPSSDENARVIALAFAFARAISSSEDDGSPRAALRLWWESVLRSR